MKYNRSTKYESTVEKAFEAKGYFVGRLMKLDSKVILIVMKGKEKFFLYVLRHKIFSKQEKKMLLEFKKKTGLKTFITWSTWIHHNIEVREIK